MYVILCTISTCGSNEEGVTDPVLVTNLDERGTRALVGDIARIQNILDNSDMSHLLTKKDKGLIDVYKLSRTCHDVSWKYTFKKVPVNLDMKTKVSESDLDEVCSYIRKNG